MRRIRHHAGVEGVALRTEFDGACLMLFVENRCSEMLAVFVVGIWTVVDCKITEHC